MKKPFWRKLTLLASFLWVASLLPAQAPPGAGIPPAWWEAGVSGSLPAWFGPVASFATARSNLWRADLRPPPGSACLAATLVFDEKTHGVARLTWHGRRRAVVLCTDIFEGAAPFHQRTFLIDRETLGGPGQLVLESSGEKPVLVRAEFSWVEPLVLEAAGWTSPGLFLSSSGKIFPAEGDKSQPNGSPSDFVGERVVDALVDPGDVAFMPNTPVRFLFSMAQAPSHGRVEARVAGLRPGEQPEIWVNGGRLSGVALEVPDLEDPGYHQMATSRGPALVYGGWRTVTASVPLGWLRRGENQIEWMAPPQAAAMSLRNVRLQARYDRGMPSSAVALVPVSNLHALSQKSATASPAARPQLRPGLSSPRGGLRLRPE
jgi:hypothetical protein